MDLSQFIAANSGKIIGTGQCGDLVDLYLVDVFGNHTEYPNAIDYWTNGIPGFSEVSNPEAGDIACYNAHGIYTAGHIAIYVGNGEVFEQNADPDGSPPHLFARATTYLLGYLRKDEVMETWNNGDTFNLLYEVAGLAVANQAAAANYVGFFGDESGKDFKTALYDIITSEQFGLLVQGLQQAPQATTLAPGTYKVN